MLFRMGACIAFIAPLHFVVGLWK